jgi:hypothetical protein
LFEAIKVAAERHAIEPAVCRWTCSILKSREIITTLSEENLRAPVAKVCSTGRLLLPVLQSLIVDGLLWELNNDGYYTVGYDDRSINQSINPNQLEFPQTVSEVLQTSVYSLMVV